MRTLELLNTVDTALRTKLDVKRSQMGTTTTKALSSRVSVVIGYNILENNNQLENDQKASTKHYHTIVTAFVKGNRKYLHGVGGWGK